MDPLGASVCNLYEDPNNDQGLREIVVSNASLSKYESRSLKGSLPQIIAALVAASFHLGNGISLAYSAVIISQLQHPNRTITATTSEKSWIASVLIVVAPVASIVGGVLIDYCGRLNTIKIAGIPGTIGWCMIALANNIPVIIIGRLLVGISSAWGTNPAMVYITEIATVEMRGSLMCIAPIYVALGMVLTYWAGWLLHWTTLAWVCNIFIIVPCLLCFLIPESPAWLVLKGRNEEAKKSLTWINKNHPQPPNRNESLAEMKLKELQEDQKKKQEEQSSKGRKGFKTTAREFLKPTAYKPLIVFIGLFICQHFSGIYITMFYSISFIEAAHTEMNGYFASILIGLVRLFMSFVSTYLLKKFNRRSLIFTSTAGMAFCMFLSGLYTKWIQEGTTTWTIMPVIGILLYVVCSTVGLLPIPLMLIAELYPLEIRGMAYSLTYSVNCIIMFAALQSYYTLNDFFGGASSLQWFFAVMCCCGFVYSYIFLPETKGQKLTDISNYFNDRIIYIGHKNDKNKNNVAQEEMAKLNNTQEKR